MNKPLLREPCAGVQVPGSGRAARRRWLAATLAVLLSATAAHVTGAPKPVEPSRPATPASAAEGAAPASAPASNPRPTR